MPQRRTISKVFVRNWVDRRANYWIWQYCFGESFIRRNMIWKNSTFNWIKTVFATTWFRSGKKKRMQKFARRQRDKESTRPQNNSSWSTSKTAKRTSIWRNRRIWLSSRSSKPAGSFESHRETCRFRLRQQIGTVTSGRREVGILGILHGLTIREHFPLSLGPVSVAWR